MPISKGQRIRLNHVETSKWLHSHLHKSPLTANQEVSAYGGPSQSDTGDVWTVTWNGSNKLWDKANTVRPPPLSALLVQCHTSGPTPETQCLVHVWQSSRWSG